MSEQTPEPQDVDHVEEDELEQQSGEGLPDREMMTILPIEPTEPINLPPVE